MPARRRRPSPPVVRVRSGASERLIERVRGICMGLPEAQEKLSHGEPTWFAGKGKVFASIDDHHHGAPHLSVWLPMPLGAQEALIDADAKRYFRPPYVGGSGWVGVVLDTKPDWGVVAGLVREAYLHVAVARLRTALLARDTGSTRAPLSRAARSPRSRRS